MKFIKSYYLLILIVLLAAFLRLWNLQHAPAGLNADEAAIGYNAYSLLQTGKDEYGASFPLAFKSFGDYKPGLYFYFVMPFVALLGLTEIAVRLPSALLGIGTVVLVYLLATRIFNHQKAGLIAALLLAVAPWHIHFSRGGWETNAATFFITLGVYLFLKGLENRVYIYWSLASFLTSIYLYQSPRLIVPVFLLTLLVLYKDVFWKRLNYFVKSKQSFFSVIILMLLSVPLILQFTSGQGSARFSGLTFFSDSGPALRTNELRGEHEDLNSTVSQLFHNKLTTYGPTFLRHYLDHFRPDFLFIRGEEVIRNKVPEVGQFYLVQSALLLAGVVFLLIKPVKDNKLILAWVLTAPLASSMTFQTPNALRSLSLVIPMILIMSYGLYWLVASYKSFSKVAIIFISSFLIFETFHYLESYFVHYPKRYPLAWEYGFDQMVAKLERYEGQYKKVVITDRYDQPYILVLFYKKYDPVKYQPQAVLTERDKFNFGTVRSFDKYEFRMIKPDEINSSKDTLFIVTKQELPKEYQELDRVNFPNEEPAFVFVKT